MLSGEQSEPNTYVSCRDFSIYYICLEKISVACATYGAITGSTVGGKESALE